MTHQNTKNNREPLSYKDMLMQDPIFDKVARAGRFRTTVHDVIALCEETNPQILAAANSRGR